MAAVIIKAGHVQPVWAGHPWVFAQAIERIEGGAAAGDEILVRDSRGNTLGRGLYSPGSAIPVRLFTRDATTAIDGALFASRIERAIARRASARLALGGDQRRALGARGRRRSAGSGRRSAGRRRGRANGYDRPEASRRRDFGFVVQTAEAASNHRSHAADARQDRRLFSDARRGAGRQQHRRLRVHGTRPEVQNPLLARAQDRLLRRSAAAARADRRAVARLTRARYLQLRGRRRACRPRAAAREKCSRWMPARPRWRSAPSAPR